MIKKMMFFLVIIAIVTFTIACNYETNKGYDKADIIDKNMLEEQKKEIENNDKFIESQETLEVETDQNKTADKDDPVEEEKGFTSLPVEINSVDDENDPTPLPVGTNPIEEEKDSTSLPIETNPVDDENDPTSLPVETNPVDDEKEPTSLPIETNPVDDENDPTPAPTPKVEYVTDKLGNEFELCSSVFDEDLNVIYVINDFTVQDLHGGPRSIYLGPGTVDPFIDKLIQFLSDETFDDLNSLSIIFGIGYRRGKTPDEVFGWEDVYTNSLVLKSVNGDEETIIFNFDDLNDYNKYSLINTAYWSSTPNYLPTFNIKINMSDYLKDNSTMLVLESGDEILCKFTLSVEKENEIYKLNVSCN